MEGLILVFLISFKNILHFTTTFTKSLQYHPLNQLGSEEGPKLSSLKGGGVMYFGIQVAKPVFLDHNQ